MFSPDDYLDLTRTEHAALFAADRPVWEAIGRISDYLSGSLRPEIRGQVAPEAHLGPKIFLGEGSVVEPGATIKGPAWIGKNCTVRAGAYVRENVIVGDKVMLGNSSEFKNCVLFDGCEIPHFNYVGDSILGHQVHLGAGAILSNVRLDRAPVRVQNFAGDLFDSGLSKFGAVIGDHTEIGCNSVLSPGSILGKRCILYPGTQWRGVLHDDQIVKLVQSQKITGRRPSG